MIRQNLDTKVEGSYRIICLSFGAFYTKEHPYTEKGPNVRYLLWPNETVEEKGLAREVAKILCRKLNKYSGGCSKTPANFFHKRDLEGTIDRKYRVEYDPNMPVKNNNKCLKGGRTK
ncbi:MAG: hypothetical protein PHH54_01170 [Candidatus Nanoarchaeia archaeon]|nr:hypothetical protein [Candidatus Nanoarchaeia archaeon]MDD5740574.1 hypothetical protein [Candidatus Nanoarchaeia archaeon]